MAIELRGEGSLAPHAARVRAREETVAEGSAPTSRTERASSRSA